MIIQVHLEAADVDRSVAGRELHGSPRDRLLRRSEIVAFASVVGGPRPRIGSTSDRIGSAALHLSDRQQQTGRQVCGLLERLGGTAAVGDRRSGSWLRYLRENGGSTWRQCVQRGEQRESYDTHM